MFRNILLAFFLCIGILVSLWGLFGWLLLPFGGKELRLNLCIRDDAEHLERQLRALYWLQVCGFLQGELTIQNCGLSDMGMKRTEILLRRYRMLLHIRVDDSGKE